MVKLVTCQIMANIKKNTQITAKKKLDVINRGRRICRKWGKWGKSSVISRSFQSQSQNSVAGGKLSVFRMKFQILPIASDSLRSQISNSKLAGLYRDSLWSQV